ncbi:DUF3088 family protein [Reinekea sp. G2M2-21]|uniref:DUF3088 family protein n=1 Tax=Reinekea sp. G2M2-21 TaxID=2788942 RepID=UPI0018AA88F9|nr:DUF3088 family protein [Reinekea sp. G2M2-21]
MTQKPVTKDTLFVLDPHNHIVDESPRFCPPCAMVTGYLHYYPEVAKQLDVITVSPVRPRRQIIEQIGEENQGSPVLILADESTVPDDIDVQLFDGRRFINESRAILKYLGQTYHAGLPL